MVRQFLETVWPIFVFARLFGMFPCKRIRNEDGSMELKPINGKVQFTLCSVFWISYMVAFSFLLFSMYNKTENTMEESVTISTDVATTVSPVEKHAEWEAVPREVIADPDSGKAYQTPFLVN